MREIRVELEGLATTRAAGAGAGRCGDFSRWRSGFPSLLKQHRGSSLASVLGYPLAHSLTRSLIYQAVASRRYLDLSIAHSLSLPSPLSLCILSCERVECVRVWCGVRVLCLSVLRRAACVAPPAHSR